MKYILFLLISISAFSCKTREKMINHNLSHNYNPGKEKISYDLLKTTTGICVILKIENYKGGQYYDGDYSAYTLSYLIKENYRSPETLFSQTREPVSPTPENTVQIDIPETYEGKLLILTFLNTRTNEYFEVDIPLINHEKSNFLIYKNNRINLRTFANPGDSLSIISENGKDSIFYLFHYDHLFHPALPPMETRSFPGRSSLSIDTVLSTRNGITFTVPLSGLYFIQSDTNTLSGKSLLVKGNKYPGITKTEEMLEPLIYITSSKEFQQLNAQENKKKAVDQFWLNTGGSKEYTRKIIQRYYQQVELANLMFTTFKEGWKTDKGMLFILFGEPDEVYRFDNYEEWIYNDYFNSGGISFIFVKKANIFCDDHYELIRRKEYEKYWIQTMKKWRNGILVK
ncbi:MAG: GWxTD domain-containing protein [Cytophagaceae bacterium]